MIVLGVSGGFGHDSAAALVIDGRPVFALEEERPRRIKEAPWMVPSRSIGEALAASECGLADVDAIATSWDPRLLDAASDPRPVLLIEDMAASLARDHGCCPPVVALPHHLCHAAAGYYTSPFDEAAVVVVDDRGEDRSGSVFRALGSQIDEVATVPIRASLGAMFSAATRYLGFDPRNAGKTMGLAAYGSPDRPLPWLEETNDGYRLVSDFVSGFGRDHQLPDWPAMFTHLFGPAAPASTSRRDHASDFTPNQLAAAASAQEAIERMVAHLAAVAVKRTGSHDLVVSGGVALNCTANGRLRSAGAARRLHVLGAAGDAGAALGAALWLSIAEGDPRPAPLPSLALGSSFDPGPVIDRARQLGLAPYDGGADGFRQAARAVGGGAIGGWYRGRDELGPRALGNRSIVARADDASVAARVNAVKGREGWRPLAPALAADAARACGLEPLDGLDHMVEARWPDAVDVISGAVHRDGSTRPLLVADAEHPLGPLLAETEHEGVGAVINTSFNVAGEPLVHTPQDALRTFCSSSLDFLCLGDVFVAKPGAPPS